MTSLIQERDFLRLLVSRSSSSQSVYIKDLNYEINKYFLLDFISKSIS